MLKGIPSIISPDLLKVLMEKVPGDEAVPTDNWDEYEKVINQNSHR